MSNTVIEPADGATLPGAAIVTGAAGGIGSAVVHAFLTRGIPVVAVDRERGESPGGAALSWVTGDAGEPEVVERAVAAARASGGPRVLVTATFTDHRGALLELAAEDVTGVIDGQIRQAWMWSTRVVASTPDPAGTAIVHISSVHAMAARDGCAPYAMAKAALEALTRAMAVEWGPLGVRCNAVAPGFVPVARNAHRWAAGAADAASMAERLPLRRVVAARDVAECAYFLAGPGAGGITGVSIPVDAGMRAALPQWA
jgi:gluconate 5-dehydrogenase